MSSGTLHRRSLGRLGAGIVLAIGAALVGSPACAGVSSFGGSIQESSSVEPILSWPDISAFKLEQGKGTIGIRVDRNPEHVDHVIFRFSRPVLVDGRALTQARVTESLRGDPFNSGLQADYYVVAIDMYKASTVKVEAVLVRSKEATAAARRGWSILEDGFEARRVKIGDGVYEGADPVEPYDGPRYLWTRSGKSGKKVDLGSAPIAENIIIIYEHWFPESPFYWRDQVLGGGIPQLADLEAHKASIGKVLDKHIPDRNFDGWVVLDYEELVPDWESAAEEARHDSLALVVERHGRMSKRETERIAEEEYEAAAGEFLLTTLRMCQDLRPKAKIGFFGLMSVYNSRIHNFEISDAGMALIDEVDVFYPSFYARKKSVDDSRRPGKDEWKAKTYRYKIKREMGMMADVAGDRPMIVFTWLLYHNLNERYGLTPVAKRDLEIMFTEPFKHGADAIAVWGHADDDRQADWYEKLVKKQAKKIMAKQIKELDRAKIDGKEPGTR